ncbi:MAG: (deoxy)nucleoside triphosphate pyrophosphohydrolase [Acidobacteria bacterium]|nr:(deoxy)nucleoside triphosphate pyrophosphohydrolase [Acidobacteriota bacterium]
MVTQKKTVVAALLWEQGRLLICQRSLKDDFPGKWEFPGGKVEPEESPQAALRRELREELGITAEVGDRVWSVEHQYPGRAAVLLVFFAVATYRGRMENRIFEQIQWVQPEQLSGYDFLEADLLLVQKLADGSIRPPSGKAGRKQ